MWMIKWCSYSRRCSIYLKRFSWTQLIGLSAVTESFLHLVQLAVKISLITFCNLLILLHWAVCLPLSSQTASLKNSSLGHFQIYREIVLALMSWHLLWEMFVSLYLNSYHCLNFCMNGFKIDLILILKDLKRRKRMIWTLLMTNGRPFFLTPRPLCRINVLDTT